MPHLDPDDLDATEAYHLLTALVVPRPIAWVSTRAPDGTPNLAPFSYFNVISNDPPVLHVTFAGDKDSLRNIRATGEFVVNVIDGEHLERANATAVDAPAEVDETALTGVELTPSTRVRPGRVATSPASLECRLHSIVEIGTGTMVFGEVLALHVADRVWRDGRVDQEALDPVGRLAGSAYQRAGEIVRIPRPSWADRDE